MKTLTVTRNKSFEWSFGVHAGLLLIAFLPFAHQVMDKEPVTYILEMGYQEIPEEMASGSEGLQARSPVFNEEPEPTTDQPAEEPIPVEETEIVEETTIAENNSDIISDVTSEEATDVVASDSMQRELIVKPVLMVVEMVALSKATRMVQPWMVMAVVVTAWKVMVLSPEKLSTVKISPVLQK